MGKSGRKSGRKGGKKRRYQRKGRKVFNNREFAALTHTTTEFDLQATGTGTNVSPSQAYSIYNFSLSSSARAEQVAQGFQEYRIRLIEMFVKPYADTYDAANVQVGTAGPGLPYFYYMVDKTGVFNNSSTTSLTLKQAGAKPIRLDDKTIRVAYKPAVQIGSSDSGTPPGPAPLLDLASTYKISPWLTTNQNARQPSMPWAQSSVDHQGIVMAAEQPRGQLPTSVASISFKIHYEFRKPFFNSNPLPGAPSPVEVDIDALDTYSPPT